MGEGWTEKVQRAQKRKGDRTFACAGQPRGAVYVKPKAGAKEGPGKLPIPWRKRRPVLQVYIDAVAWDTTPVHKKALLLNALGIEGLDSYLLVVENELTPAVDHAIPENAVQGVYVGTLQQLDVIFDEQDHSFFSSCFASRRCKLADSDCFLPYRCVRHRFPGVVVKLRGSMLPLWFVAALGRLCRLPCKEPDSCALRKERTLQKRLQIHKGCTS
ncbi:hypothetical protein HPB51_000027 [Rhipicephalus microplus]|uniref:Uncharacterized protein n=1 Tax=Rhipicephalus microplus TaxID=6941 RepID=A0A9J6E5L9_RHIMP|nr:hypothetical protein HPB51_000027 [Rhipicephalus microplus]